MKKTVLALGPYIGDFKNEILNFQPHIKWIHEVVGIDNVYVCTHRNRSFLYNFPHKFIPVGEHISRDENGQHGYTYGSLNQKDFNTIIKMFKEEIVEKEKCSKKDIDIHFLKYIKSTPSYPIHKKIFEKIPLGDVEDEYKDKLIFIPDTTTNLVLTDHILEFLKDKGFMIIGDMKTNFPDENKILSDINYFENGYLKILKYITMAKAVVCPLGHWTVIANMQKSPVFSWGESVGQYREGGIHYLGNEKSFAFPTYKDIKPKGVLRMLSHFLKEV